MKWSDVNLQRFWTEIFHIELFPIINEEDDEESQNFSLLLSTLLMLHKNVKRQLYDAEIGLNASRKELLRLKETQCVKCIDFKTEAGIYEKKLRDHEKRIKTIANILNLHKMEENCEDSQSNTSTTKAFNLVSQMLLGGKSDLRSHIKRSGKKDKDDEEVSKKYKSDSEHSDEVGNTSESLVLQRVSGNVFNRDNIPTTIIIPETVMELNTPMDVLQGKIRPCTPPKQVIKQNQEVVSPVFSDVKKFSRKRNTPNCRIKLNESVEACEPSATNSLPLTEQSPFLFDGKNEISESDQPSKQVYIKNKPDKKNKSKLQRKCWLLEIENTFQ